MSRMSCTAASYNDKDTHRRPRGASPSPRPSNIRLDLTADYSQDDAALNVGRPVNNLTTFSGGVLVVDQPVGSGSYDWRGRITPGLPNSTKLTHCGVCRHGWRST